MRKFIIRQFALNYTFKLFNRYWTALRVSRYIMSSFVTTGILFTLFGWNLFSICSGIITLIFLYFGFIHFEIFPIKKEEYHLLDEDQKKQFDYFQNLH